MARKKPLKWERLSFILEVNGMPMRNRIVHRDISFHDKESKKIAEARAAQSAVSRVESVHVDHQAKEVFIYKSAGHLSKVASYSSSAIEPPAEEAEEDLFAMEQVA